MNLSPMKYIEMRKHQNNDFKRCQDFEDMGKIRCICQNGSRHKNKLLTISFSKLLKKKSFPSGAVGKVKCLNGAIFHPRIVSLSS